MGSCLYCKQTVGPFSSVEHIFPETLGNDQFVLPRGTVCDKCNHGILAKLDDALLKFEPIAFMRTLLGIPNKVGRVPTASFSGMKMKRKAADRISIRLQGRGRDLLPTARGFRLKFSGHRYTIDRRRTLIRSFYKIGLGFVHFDHGAQTSSAIMFDSIREIILGSRKDFKGFLAVSAETKPQLRCEAKYRLVVTAKGVVVPFQVTLFGIHFLFDLMQPVLADPESLRNQDFMLLTC